MNSTNNNSFEIAAKKVFSDLYDLIKEDEYKIYENNVSSFSFNITEDELNKTNSKEDITEIFNIISSYDKELVSTIKKIDDGFITHPKTTHTKTYDKYVCQSLEAIRTNNNFLLCKEFKKKLFLDSDMNKYIIVVDKTVKRLIVIVYNTNIISNEIDDKPKQINVLDSSTDIKIDDKPKPVNLLDLSPDILNIIGDFIKKDNKKELMMKKELMDGEQIINGRKIIFPTFCGGEIDRSLNTKEDIKEHIFDYIISNFPYIKKCATMFKIRLSNDDKRKCFWILFKRCKLIINRNKEYYNKDVYNMDDNEEKEFFMEYLKLKNLSLPKNTTFEY